MSHFSNPLHYHPFPTAHSHEFAIYDQVRPDATQAPTGLTLKASEASKRWVDELGVEHAPPASIAYRPAQAGQGGTLVDKTYVDEYLTRTYTNKLTFHDRLAGVYEWTTTIQDSGPATEVSLQWLVIDHGTESSAPGEDRGLPGTGAGKQSLEYLQERWDENVQTAGLDTYAHHNPTVGGTGQAPDRDPDGPFADYDDPYSRRRVYGSRILHWYVGDDYFEVGFDCIPDFRGDGSANTATVGHANFGDGPESPRIWVTRKGLTRITPNYGKGTVATSAMIHRADHWLYSSDGWVPRGVAGPQLAGMAHNQSMVPLHFTKGYVVDLALGNSALYAVDVDTIPGGPTFDRPTPGTHWSPSWAQKLTGIIVKQGASSSQFTLDVPGSPYRASIVHDPVSDIAIAHAVKLGHFLVYDSGHPQARIDGSPFQLNLFRFINPDTTAGNTKQGYADLINADCKTHGPRAPGWIAQVSYTVAGTLLDVAAALDEIFARGMLDEPPCDVHPTITAGTIWPPNSAYPTPLGEGGIVFITGDSEVVAGDKAWLQLERNAELGKFPMDDPMPSRNIRTLDTRKQVWNDDRERWEILRHGVNASGWGYSASTSFGFETSLCHALLRRESIDEVFIIKCAFAGAPYGADQGVVASWEGDEDNLQTITATATITPTSTGATIVAAAGTFSSIPGPCGIEIDGSLYVIGSHSEPNFLQQTAVTFSTLSVRRTGNNTYRNRPLLVTSISVDGSTITVGKDAGGGTSFAFASETRSFTFTMGKFSIRRMAGETVARAKEAMRRDMRLTPRLLLSGDQSGNNDTGSTQEDVQRQVTEQAAWVRGLFDVNVAAADCPPHAVVKTSSRIFLGTDEGLEGVRQAQEDAVDDIPNGFIVKIDDLPIVFEGNGDATQPWPPVDRTDNGVHMTSSACIQLGFRIDSGLDAFSFFPATVVEEVNSAGDDYFVESAQEEDVMTLVVEDGTGLDDSDSYADVSFGDTYFASLGGSPSWSGANTATKTAALRAATQYLDLRFGRSMNGQRLSTTQALSAPRTRIVFDGRVVTGIPNELKKATAEAANRWIQDPAQLLPDEAAGSNVTSKSVDIGGIRIGKSFVGGASTSKSFPIVEKLMRLSGLVASGDWVSS